MNTLMKCRTCAREISSAASTCPHCGEKYINEGRRFLFLLGAIILFFVGLAVVCLTTGIRL